MRQLKDDPENEGKAFKLEIGVLKMDAVPVDRNTFSS